ncbi:aBC-type antimicrobial peptide transport system permease component [Clostridium sp. CAG:964]|nr:aBC-type antimicrobial peptide transport system permease component [Clostridium sp. CAG:964]
MRISNNLFLARANLKGSKRKNTVMVMMILSVVAVTLLVGFLSIVNTTCDEYKNKKICRQGYIMPESCYSNDEKEVTKQGITDKTIGDVLSLEHVVSCERAALPTVPELVTITKITDENDKDISNTTKHVVSCERAALPTVPEMITITKITDENNKDVSNTTSETNLDKLTAGLGEQFYDSDYINKVIKGTGLDKAPEMSCILPHTFTYEDIDEDLGNTVAREKISTESLIGKTITVDLEYLIHQFTKGEKRGYEKGYLGEWTSLPKITYKLKVVGIYYYSKATSLDGGDSILVSKATAEKIDKMALDNAVKNGMKDDLDDYINDEYARDYVVTADSIDNIAEVMSQLKSMGFNAGVQVGYIDESMLAFTGIFGGVGTFLTAAILHTQEIMLLQPTA